MSKGAIEFWVGMSWVLAVLTVGAAVLICVGFGAADVPVRYGTEKVINWPLIAGAVVSAVYAVLFAVAMSIIKVSALNSRTMLELALGKSMDAAEQPAESDQDAGRDWS